MHHVTGGEPVDQQDASVWVELLNFYGPPGSFQTVSLWSLLEDKAFERLKQQNLFRDATVLIANTTMEIRDLHPTPFARIDGMPGVEIHATALANLREGNQLFLMRMNHWVAFGLFVWTGLLVLVLQAIERPERRFGLMVVVSAALITFTVLIANHYFRLLPVAHLEDHGTCWSSFSERAWFVFSCTGRDSGQRCRSTSRLLWLEMTQDMDRLQVSLGGQAYDVIVLMTDIRGFLQRKQPRVPRKEL